jgi:hypothetical protein
VADKRHTYSIRVDWTGNQGTGTSAYRAYSRAHEISAQGKTAIDCVGPGSRSSRPSLMLCRPKRKIRTSRLK